MVLLFETKLFPLLIFVVVVLFSFTFVMLFVLLCLSLLNDCLWFIGVLLLVLVLLSCSFNCLTDLEGTKERLVSTRVEGFFVSVVVLLVSLGWIIFGGGMLLIIISYSSILAKELIGD